jgi:hypothetical protein
MELFLWFWAMDRRVLFNCVMPLYCFAYCWVVPFLFNIAAVVWIFFNMTSECAVSE